MMAAGSHVDAGDAGPAERSRVTPLARDIIAGVERDIRPRSPLCWPRWELVPR